MDLLSSIMTSVRIESTGIVLMNLSSPWGLLVEKNPAASLFSLVEGQCEIRSATGETLLLHAGDVVLLSHSEDGEVASDGEAPRASLRDVFEANELPLWKPGSSPAAPLRLTHGGGGDPAVAFSLIFGFREQLSETLLSVMPSLIVLRKDEYGAFPWIEMTLDFLRHEAENPDEGYAAVASRLAELLFVYILRAHLLLHPEQTSGWMRGASDKRIARALGAMHERMNEPWKLATLASVAGMSRSTFAARFAELVGRPPLEYLLHRRMEAAADRLASGEGSLEQLARDVGYSSQHSFTVAFTRIVGMPPAQYRRSKATQASDDQTVPVTQTPRLSQAGAA